MSEARVWDRLAGRYDTVVRLFDSSYGRVRDRLVRDLPPGGRLLEIAAGTGQFTVDLASRAEHLVATDISPEMVARLQIFSAEVKALNGSYLKERRERVSIELDLICQRLGRSTAPHLFSGRGLRSLGPPVASLPSLAYLHVLGAHA